MSDKTCVVVFSESTGRSVGKILKDGEVVKELSFYLGKLHSTEPAAAEDLIRSRYSQWAEVNGIRNILIEFRKD